MFQRHKFLSYHGYSFPWYIVLMWACFFVFGMTYLVKYILLK